MAYVTSLAAAARDDSNWQASLPPGGDWQVVLNQDSQPQDFNQGAGGKFIYVYYQLRDTGNPVSSVMMLDGQGATPPAGWTKVDVDLNQGAGGDFIYLAYATTAGAPGITRFTAGVGDNAGDAFEALGISAAVLGLDANRGAKGKFIYLGYYYT